MSERLKFVECDDGDCCEQCCFAPGDDDCLALDYLCSGGCLALEEEE